MSTSNTDTDAAAAGSAVEILPVAEAASAVDCLLYRGATVAIGAWRCPPGHPMFEDSGPIRDHCFAFPRNTTRIRRARGQGYVADPNVVELYAAEERYSRTCVSPEGAVADYFVLAPGVAAEAGAESFGAAAPVGAALYLEQRRVFRAAVRGADALALDEAVLQLFDAVARPSKAPAAGDARHAELVEDARAALSERLDEPLPLATLARRLGRSAFHLCRVFRARTGSTLHAYRQQLRLRAALAWLEDGADVTRVALDAGFSSHSHFTAAFRLAFGTTPSRFRAC
jgi:AraC-like DNA-binding protein